MAKLILRKNTWKTDNHQTSRKTKLFRRSMGLIKDYNMPADSKVPEMP